MQLQGDLGTLTYCLNIHPTQSWADARAALTGPVTAVKANISPDAPFATGLRFSWETVEELRDPAKREDLRQILADHDLQPVTMNGFPFGPFHGTRVKEQVYLPDWQREERITYTTALADLLAELNPKGTFVSLSTVPCAFRGNVDHTITTVIDNYVRVVAHLVELEARTGRQVALAIEPEPYCHLETIAETVTFFETGLYGPAAQKRLSELTGCAPGEAGSLLRRHLGLCYDVCHAAVEYEDAAGSIRALKAADIPVHKLQLSSALQIAQGSDDAREALKRFDEPVYLHQLIARAKDGSLTRYSDLGPALAAGAAKDGEEWRVHFHVPVFLETLPEFGTTQSFLREILAIHRKDPISPHLEVETYTWDVLPDNLVAGSVDQAITRELEWVIKELNA